MMISDWRDLPFGEILVVDTEFYPGAWTATLCSSPTRTAQSSVSTLPATGGSQPVRSIGRIKSGDREKGFYSIGGALRYFGEDGVDTAYKQDMRGRILQGPPFTNQERTDILDYCESDVDALARLVPYIIPTIRSLPHAMFRAQFAWVTAQQERRGIPIDPILGRLRDNWDAMAGELVAELGAPYGCYEFDADGKPHWRRHLFADYVRREGMSSWPTHPDGTLDERDATFREMEGLYPQTKVLRELRYSLSALRLNSLSVGNDWRNRTLLCTARRPGAISRPTPSTFSARRNGSVS
jgi:DNA polymerase-1